MRRRMWWTFSSALGTALAASACSAGGGADLGPRGTTGGAGGQATGGASAGAAGASQGGSHVGGTVSFGATGSGGAPPTSGGSTGEGGAAGAPSACSPPSDTPTEEVCDGLDNDLNGFIDEARCPCGVGSTQPCFDGPPSQANATNCHMGTQTCERSGEFGQWGPCVGSGCDAVTREEICDNTIDDDCDGIVDEGCYLDAEVNLDGDCLSAFCPPQAPNPVGCDITMEGGDARGCVSHAPGSSEVYFQEGNACPLCIPGFPCTGGAGRVFGTLRCSSRPEPVTLDATNCVINKAEPLYATPSLTPITQLVSGCPQ